MAYTPSGLSVADAEELSRRQQEAIKANLPQEGQIFLRNAGEGAQQISVFKDGVLYSLGFQYPDDWGGKRIGDWQTETTNKAITKFGNLSDLKSPNSADFETYLQKQNIPTKTITDINEFGNIIGGDRNKYGGTTQEVPDVTTEQRDQMRINLLESTSGDFKTTWLGPQPGTPEYSDWFERNRRFGSTGGDTRYRKVYGEEIYFYHNMAGMDVEVKKEDIPQEDLSKIGEGVIGAYEIKRLSGTPAPIFDEASGVYMTPEQSKYSTETQAASLAEAEKLGIGIFSDQQTDGTQTSQTSTPQDQFLGTQTTSIQIPSGVLVRDSSNGKIYLIDNGTKRHITNMDTLNLLPADKKYWTNVDASYLNIPDGPAIDNLVAGAVKTKAESENMIYNLGANLDQPSTESTEQPQQQKIGDSAVNHLYQLYLNRDANQGELDMYKNHLDDSILRKDLEFAKKNEAERVQTQTEEDKATADQDQVIVDQAAKENADIAGADPTSQEAVFRSGDKALIKFAEDPDGPGPQSTNTIYIIDKNTNTIKPILSEEAYNNKFVQPLSEAMAQGVIKTISINDIGESGMFSGFKLLTDEYGLREDGTSKPYDTGVDVSKIKQTYGKTLDQETIMEGIKEFKGTLSWLKNQEDSGLSAETIDEALGDPNLLSFYVNAMKAGGYLVNDVYRDLKRKQLIKEGRDDLVGMKIISPDIPANQYHLTEEYREARANADIAPPSYIGDVDTGLLENPIFDIPSNAYDILVPPIDWTTPEGQAELDKIKSSYHDLLLEQAKATTERDKTIADYKYNKFKEDVERQFNITLSDNSSEAWNQINQLGSAMSKRGLAGSGLEEEARDRYLKDIRKGDERLRESRITTEEEGERQHLLQYGSAAEIAALSPEEKEKYGFTPSQETRDWFSKENLKKLYPNMTEDQINKFRESMFDIGADGELNYKSTLYQQLFKNKYGADYGLVVPEAGILPAKRAFQEAEAIKARLREEGDAYKEYIKEEPFSYTGEEEVADSSQWGVTQPEEGLSTEPSITGPAPEPTITSLTLQGLLADRRVTQDQGVNNVTMAQWLQGNASLIPQLAQRGYTIDDLINEAYSQTRYDRSAFSGDMMSVDRSGNIPYTAPKTTYTPPKTTYTAPAPTPTSTYTAPKTTYTPPVSSVSSPSYTPPKTTYTPPKTTVPTYPNITNITQDSPNLTLPSGQVISSKDPNYEIYKRQLNR